MLKHVDGRNPQCALAHFPSQTPNCIRRRIRRRAHNNHSGCKPEAETGNMLKHVDGRNPQCALAYFLSQTPNCIRRPYGSDVVVDTDGRGRSNYKPETGTGNMLKHVDGRNPQCALAYFLSQTPNCIRRRISQIQKGKSSPTS